MSEQNERVLVIPSADFDRIGRFQGFSPEGKRYLSLLGGFVGHSPAGHPLAGRSEPVFKPRSEVETDPSWKQPIPYAVISTTGGQVFWYRRAKKGGDSRLAGNRSIGIGGHVNETDRDPNHASAGPLTPYHHVIQAMAREVFREELEFPEDKETWYIANAQIAGFLNDDSNAVGQVHLGVIFSVLIDSTDHVRVRDESIVESGWADGFSALLPDDGFETWSQILIRHYAEREQR